VAEKTLPEDHDLVESNCCVLDCAASTLRPAPAVYFLSEVSVPVFPENAETLSQMGRK
jgi:hypothetical protein